MSPKLSTVKATIDVVSGVQHFIPDKDSTFSTPLEGAIDVVDKYIKAKHWMLLHGAEFYQLLGQARNDPRCYSEKYLYNPNGMPSVIAFPCMEHLGWTAEQVFMVWEGEKHTYFLKHHLLLHEGEKIVRGVSELIQSNLEAYEAQEKREEKIREELGIERGRRLGRFVKRVRQKTREILLYPVW